MSFMASSRNQGGKKNRAYGGGGSVAQKTIAQGNSDDDSEDDSSDDSGSESASERCDEKEDTRLPTVFRVDANGNGVRRGRNTWDFVDRRGRENGGSTVALFAIDPVKKVLRSLIKNSRGDDPYPELTEAYLLDCETKQQEAEIYKPTKDAVKDKNWADVIAYTSSLLSQALETLEAHELKQIIIPKVDIPFPFRCSNVGSLMTMRVAFQLPPDISKPLQLCTFLKNNSVLKLYASGDSIRQRFAGIYHMIEGKYHFQVVGVRLQKQCTKRIPLPMRYVIKSRKPRTRNQQNGDEQVWVLPGPIVSGSESCCGQVVQADTHINTTLLEEVVFRTDPMCLLGEVSQRWKNFDLEAMKLTVKKWMGKGDDPYVYVPVGNKNAKRFEHALVHMFVTSAPAMLRNMVSKGGDLDDRFKFYNSDRMIVEIDGVTKLKLPAETAMNAIKLIEEMMQRYDSCICLDEGLVLELTPAGPTGDWSALTEHVRESHKCGLPAFEYNAGLNLWFEFDFDVIPIKACPMDSNDECRLPVHLGQVSPDFAMHGHD